MLGLLLCFVKPSSFITMRVPPLLYSIYTQLIPRVSPEIDVCISNKLGIFFMLFL